MKLNKNDLIKEYSEKEKIPFSKSKKHFNNIFKLLSQEIKKGNTVMISGLGKFITDEEGKRIFKPSMILKNKKEEDLS
ncbi:HU family DNA-binding protein [Leptotrichia sp. OH3620_COT-345]|uniref:HU family DNA-binding protein n=1 Tax=Leptotrichia sp. OH3620_COT-345 TaxID=2491048 RepID=UPI0013156550|nr:HU family DNA-binding protein [Leptotrichia sp. OH3620_COT-345]